MPDDIDASVSHISPSEKASGVSVLAASSSAVDIGVASSGSSVRASFSPMTACAASAIEPTTGTISMSSPTGERETPGPAPCRPVPASSGTIATASRALPRTPRIRASVLAGEHRGVTTATRNAGTSDATAIDTAGTRAPGFRRSSAASLRDERQDPVARRPSRRRRRRRRRARGTPLRAFARSA